MLELQHEGYQPTSVHNGTEALEQLHKHEWDLVILDVMIPEISGMEVLRRFRRQNDWTPVLLLTARDSVIDKVQGLDSGANDYITKPFDIEELLARIRAAFRMAQNHFSSKKEMQEETVTIADLQVNVSTRQVQRNGESITLTKREFDLLLYLLRNQRLVLTREQLLDEVWGFEYMGDTNVVDVYIGYLRKKIDQGFDQSLIHTIRGVGFTIKESG